MPSPAAAEGRQDYPLEEKIIREYLSELSHNRVPKIARGLGVGIEEIKDAVQNIASLNPLPGKLFGGDPPHYVKPDVIVDEVETSMGLEAMLLLLNKSLASRVSQMANAYRNAPIQGGVADVMLEAYGLLHERLSQFDRAVGVQTVHDSVVVECDRVDAVRVAHMVKDTMEEAMQIWCPDVAAKADTDIRASLSDRDVIESI